VIDLARYKGLLPAAAGLRPLEQVVDRAEVVRDAVLASMPDEEHVHVAQLAPAVRAGAGLALGAVRLVERTRLPVRALDRPRDHMLEAAEGGAAVAGRLVQAKAVVVLDAGPAPGATLGGHLPK
jgi:hypothetical protein